MRVPTADQAIRAGTALAVLVVAGIAATVSFLHIRDLALTYGQPPLAAWLLPISVDGTVAAASLAMLWAARNTLPSPWLARGMLGLGVAATLGANAAFGAQYGWPGILVSVWPGIAFVGSVEMALLMVRTARRVPALLDRARPGMTKARAASNGHDLIAARFRAELAAGKLPSYRRVMKEMRVGQAKAREIRSHLAAMLETVGD